MVKAHSGERKAVSAKRVNIAFALPPEAAKFDPELQRGARSADELGFVEPDTRDERAQMRQGRLAHPDDADLRRFNQTKGHGPAEKPHESSGGHPAGGTTTDNHHPLDLLPIGSLVRHPSPGRSLFFASLLPPTALQCKKGQQLLAGLQGVLIQPGDSKS